jgi:hypothetical protein
MSSASDTDADAEWEDDWVHKPIWWLDGALAAAYFLEVYHLVFHVFLAPGPGRREEDGPVLLATVAGLTAATAIVIHALNAASEAGGRWLSDGPLRAAPFNRPLRTRKSMRKFKAQFWQLVVHVAFAVLEWRVLHDEPSWFEQPWRCFVPAPHHQTNKPEVHQLYLTQIGVWLYMGVCQCCFLDKQKDYYQLMSHHIITLALVGMSFHYNYVRAGVVILFICDASDIFMDLMKLANYLQLEDRPGCYITEFFWASTLIFWPYFRLYLLPSFAWNGISVWLWWFNPYEHYGLGNPYAHSCPRDSEHEGLLEECDSNLEVTGMLTNWLTALFGFVLICALIGLSAFWWSLVAGAGYDILFGFASSTRSLHKAGAKQLEGSDRDTDTKAA